MKKVWINPAYKDLVQAAKPEEKPVVKEQANPKPEKKKDKQQPEAKPEQKIDNSIIQITEPVIEKLKEKGINTDTLTDLLNKEFTKKGLKDELKQRGIPDGDIDKIICRVKEKKEQNVSLHRPGFREHIEHKLFKYFRDNGILIEIRLVTGNTFTGKLKWFSEWLMGLEIDGKAGTVILNRLMFVCYIQLQGNNLSGAELYEMFPVNIAGVESKMMQPYRNNKIPLLFHMNGGMEIKGTLDWYEKLVYHIKSLDGKTEYTICRSNILYIEEVS